MLVLASNCLFYHRLRSCVYFLHCLETIYQQHSLLKFFNATLRKVLMNVEQKSAKQKNVELVLQSCIKFANVNSVFLTPLHLFTIFHCACYRIP